MLKVTFENEDLNKKQSNELLKVKFELVNYPFDFSCLEEVYAR